MGTSGLQQDERAAAPWATDEGHVTASGIATEADAQRFVELVATVVNETASTWDEALAADAASKPDTGTLKTTFAEALAGLRLQGEPL